MLASRLAAMYIYRSACLNSVKNTSLCVSDVTKYGISFCNDFQTDAGRSHAIGKLVDSFGGKHKFSGHSAKLMVDEDSCSVLFEAEIVGLLCCRIETLQHSPAFLCL